MSTKTALAICDVCGFRYPMRQMKKNSYNLLVCPTDFDGGYDLKNHPQNRTPYIYQEEIVRNARPPSNNDRNIDWEDGETWEETSKNWNQI